MTLWFVGDTAPEQVDPLIAVLRASVGAVERFTTELGGGGTYPSDRGARVAWVGFREPLAWRGLVAAMAEAAAALAWPVEQRPASPHVTLARPRPPWSQRVSERWRQAVPARLGGPFEVSQAVLYHSKLGPAGARHEALAALPLGGGR